VGADVWRSSRRSGSGGAGRRSEDRLFPIDMEYFGEVFQKACARARIRPTITPHDLRRTYASRMAHKVIPKVLQLLLGHSDIKVTMEHYVDVKEAELAAAVARVGNPIEG
jgi:integrase